MNYSNKLNILNPGNKPMVESDFYQFLSNGGYCNNATQVKVNYLKTFGFKKGKDKIDGHCLQVLRYIHQQYFDLNIKPALVQAAKQRELDSLAAQGITY